MCIVSWGDFIAWDTLNSVEESVFKAFATASTWGKTHVEIISANKWTATRRVVHTPNEINKPLLMSFCREISTNATYKEYQISVKN